MRMKKSLILPALFLLALSLLLASCSQTIQRGENYKVGTPDLKLEIFGIEKGYQERAFKLPMILSNLLGYDIQNVKISLVGLDRNYVNLLSESQNIPLIEGRSSMNSEGGTERLEFEGLIGTLLPGAEQNQQKYRVFVNYDSKMEFSPTICVNPNFYSGVYDAGCTPVEKASYDGQGAPLAVTSMEVVQGQELELRITLSNRGAGEVGKVALGIATLGGKPLACEFKGGDKTSQWGLFSSSKKDVQLLCSQLLQGTNSYETPIYIEFFYNYELDFSNSLSILR